MKEMSFRYPADKKSLYRILTSLPMRHRVVRRS